MARLSLRSVVRLKTTRDDRPAVCFTGAVKSFGAVHAVDGIGLEIRRGENAALLGRNGAGKSTTISLLLGLDEPDAGTVRLFERRLLAAALPDNGRGVSSDKAVHVSGGTGLKGLTERLAAAGGTLDAGASTRGGFLVSAELPAGTDLEPEPELEPTP